MSTLGSSRRITIAYRGGTVTIELVVVDDDGHELEAGAALAWRQMVLAAELDDVKLAVRTAFRGFEYQRRLYEAHMAYQAYLAKKELWEKGGKVGPEPEKTPFAALANKPGTSTHEIGNAVDVVGAAPAGSKIDLWLSEHARKYGWKRTVPSEVWHYNWMP